MKTMSYIRPLRSIQGKSLFLKNVHQFLYTCLRNTLHLKYVRIKLFVQFVVQLTYYLKDRSVYPHFVIYPAISAELPELVNFSVERPKSPVTDLISSSSARQSVSAQCDVAYPHFDLCKFCFAKLTSIP